MSEELSAADIRILEQLQKDASLSTGELADKVGLSQSPCWRRLQRLKEEGFIRGQVALLNREKLGPSMIIFAVIKMSTLTEEQRAQFIRTIELTPQILECYTIFGEMDIMIKVDAISMSWYQDFIFNVVLKLPGVVDVQSTVTLKELKYTTALPLRGSLAL